MADYRRYLYPWNYYKRRIFAFVTLLAIAVLMLFFKLPKNVIFSRDYLIFNIGTFDVTSSVVAGILLIWIGVWIWRGNTRGI